MTIAELAAKYEQYVIDMRRRSCMRTRSFRTMRNALSAASGRSWTSWAFQDITVATTM